VHGKDKAEEQISRVPSAVQSDEVRSADRLVGRHRAGEAPSRLSSGRARIRARLSSTPVRLVLATGLTCCLGFVAVIESRSARTPEEPLRSALADREAAVADQPASRSSARAGAPVPTTAKPTSTRTKPTPTRTKPAPPRPVAGLTQAQMDNAAIIVRVGRELDIPQFGLTIAVATAMQESNLYNLASEVLPESKNYPHQGTGWDHDSVGLFQQRTSSGWGAVEDLMRPAYAAQAFFQALQAVPGWLQLSLSSAAQAVQVSAFPDAYAQHETRAVAVVAALLA
jgi:hypothetical protein